MERLTIPDVPIEGGMRRAIIDVRTVKEQAMTLYWKLKEYEDTGLTPEQIQEIDKLYAEKCREVAELKAMLPPCKVGDVMYRIKSAFSPLQEPKEEIIERITITCGEISALCKSGWKFNTDKLGETVFLTSAEAEQALEKMKGEKCREES